MQLIYYSLYVLTNNLGNVLFTLLLPVVCVVYDVVSSYIIRLRYRF